MLNPFFKNKGPFNLKEILDILNTQVNIQITEVEIKDIKDLYTSTNSDITFYHSKKYREIAKNTKASFCITSQALKTELPNSCTPLVVDNILVAVSKLTAKFYPDAVNDNFDETAKNIDETEFKDKVKHGKNVLVGENVNIGSNCLIGHNTIIEKNVSIGNNCSIGSNTVIRNTIIKNNVIINPK